MTDDYGRAPADVRAWPTDPTAREALRKYLEELPKEGYVDEKHLFGGDGMDYTGADLSGLFLSEAVFVGSVLNGVCLVGADMFATWLIDAKLRGADLSGCSLYKAKAWRADARGAVLRGAWLERSECELAIFRHADLSRVRFGRGWLYRADLRGADLSECVFGGTGLTEARLAGCRLVGAHGKVSGPIDIGVMNPHMIDGGELQAWFASQGAPLVEVTTPRS